MHKNYPYSILLVLTLFITLISVTNFAFAQEPEVSTYAGTGDFDIVNGDVLSASFAGPVGIALDSSNNVYVADATNNQIRIIYADNKTVATYAGSIVLGVADGTTSSARFSIPVGIELDSNGNVYVGDSTYGTIRIIYTNGTVDTYAGNGTVGDTNGNASSAQFNGTHDIELNPNGDLYVADLGNNQIRIIYKNKTVATYAGSGTAGDTDGNASSAQFNRPQSVALNPDGNLYVADTSNHKIRIIYANRTVGTYAGNGSQGSVDGDASSAQFNGPRGLALDSNGNLYVSDSGNNQIRIIYTNGTVDTIAGNRTAGDTDGIASSAQFYTPIGLALDSNGNLYVSDSSNNRIRKITPPPVVTLQITTYAGTGVWGLRNGDALNATFYAPFGIDVAPNGDLYVTDYSNATIRIIYNNTKTVATYAGNETPGYLDGNISSAQFKNPRGIALAPNGDLYVADILDRRIRIIYVNGTVATYAGNGSYGRVDGNASNATFSSPVGLALNSKNGDLYVAEIDTDVIRIIYKNKTVDTYAGSGAQGFKNGDALNAQFSNPNDLALAPNGDLYVADHGNRVVRVIYANGTVATYAGNGQAGYHNGDALSAKFRAPFGLALAPNGDLYVADLQARLIRIIYANGTVDRIAGTGETKSVDGDLLDSSFRGPAHLALADNGDLYIVDMFNGLIRKISSDAPPIIILSGANPQFIELNSSYTELGATTNDDSPLTINSSSVDTNQIGNYTVTYDARDAAGNDATQVSRNVTVQDTTAPTITLSGANPQFIELNSSYTELGANVSDNSGKQIVPQINNSSVDTNQTGTYTVTYDATDATENNATQVNRTIIVQNTITLGTSWTTRQQIDINSSQIPTTLTNFTILISINSTNLNSSAVQSDGDDIRFTSSDGVTLLNHEIESFSNDITSGSLVAWVRIPTLSSFNDTTIFIYYNAPNATSTALYSYTVWDSDYEIIYHMNQTTFDDNSTLDSTSNNRHGTPTSEDTATFGSNDLVDAIIGKGLDFDGINTTNGNYIDLPDLDSSLFAPTYTISLWLNFDTLQHNRVYSFLTTNNTHAITMIQHLETGIARFTGSTSFFQINNTITTNNWSHFTLVQNTTSATAYKDGVQIGSNSDTYTAVNVLRDSAQLGGFILYSSDEYYDGQIDEFRLSSTARSADWIATEYANQKSPNTFYTVSGLEASRDPTADTTPPVITLNGSSTIVLQVGATYTELGATTDDNSTVRIGGDTVNTNIVGNYTVTYDATDTSNNNATQLNRTVIVREAPPITRQQIIINSNQIPSTLYNFTVLISINSPDLNSSAIQSNGNYTSFTSSDGVTLLNHEIESFSNDITGGNLVAWVRIPTLSSSDNTTIFIYYNVPNVTASSSSSAWDSDYEIIYHMNQNTFGANSILDSTSNNRHATTRYTGSSPFDSDKSVPTIIGNGLDFDGKDAFNKNYLDLPDLESSLFRDTNYTISYWLNFDNDDGPVFIDFATANSTNLYTIRTQYYNGVYQVYLSQGGSNDTSISHDSSSYNDVWVYYTVVISSLTVTSYANGENATHTVEGDYINPADIPRTNNYIGHTASHSSYYDGQMDEFRLSSTARSADWITTEYNNQLSPNTFYTIYSPEVVDTAVNFTDPVDTTPPIITLNGNSTITIEFGDTYTELGATTDDNSTVRIGGDTVNTNIVGNYTVTYDATDTSNNNATQINRTVIVQKAPPITRQQIVINSSQIPSTLYNFTVLISMNSTNLNSSTIQSDGSDISFTSSDGVTLLNHEIESFSNDITGGSLVAWVRIPTLSSSDNTTIFIYYNAPNVTASSSSSAWDSDYEIIYHMNQSTFGANSTLDSTSNNRHATPLFEGNSAFDSSNLVSTIIGNGLDFGGNTTDKNYLDLPDLESSLFRDTDYTISYWLNLDGDQDYRFFTFATANSSNSNVIQTTYGNADFYTFFEHGDSNTTFISGSSNAYINTWAYYTVVISSLTVTNYENGQNATTTSDDYFNSADVLRTENYIGNTASYITRSSYYDGQMDEFRLSSTARSADWITTEYNNQLSPNTFYTIHSLEVVDTAVDPTDPVDTTPPIITLNGNRTITLQVGDTYTELDATTDDNSTVRIGGDIVDTSRIGNYTVTYDATDTSNNNATQLNRTVTVQDTIPPSITLFGNNPQFIKLNLPYTELGANVSDNSGEQINPQINSSSVNTNQTGTYIVTYDAADTSGNNATQVSRNVTVQDTTAPIITLSGINPQIIELNSKYTELGATVDDNSTLIINSSSVNTNQIGNYTVTYDATDTEENKATQVNRTVIVQDTTPPVITLNGNSTITLEFGNTYTEQNATTDDNSTVRIGGDIVDTSRIGNYTVTYDATDTEENKATQVNRTVIVQDTTLPVITLNGNSTITIEFGNTYTELGATTDDNSTVRIDGDIVNTSRIGNYTVTYDATDTAKNNATQVNRTVIVQDTTLPVITLNGNSTITIEFGNTYTELGATTDDNSTVRIGGDTVNTSRIGNYTVTYDATDTAKNNATQVNRTVIVQDTTLPVITLNGNSTITLEFGDTYTELGATTDDNSTLIINSSSVNTNQIGNYTVTYDATDTAKNKATQVNRTIIVQDTIPPIITLSGNNPQFIKLNLPYTELGATVSDNSGEQIVPQINSSSVNTNQTGTYIVTYDAADTSGNNAAQVSRNVTVQNTTAPIITLSGINPQIIELNSKYDELGATVDDNSTLIINSSSVNTNQIGNYTVTYDATDTAKNKATQVNRTIIVQDTIPPIITLSGNNPQIIELNSKYTELGATVSDNSTLIINSSSVNTNQIGTYTVTYDATDDARNNATQVNRTVIVQNTITLDTSWITRQRIDINSSQIPTTLTNFTILISINSTNLNSSAVQSNGNDIRFTSSDGVSLLNHEIESFSNDITSGSLVAWVRIPTLSSFIDTTIFIYYNVPNATAPYSYTVWDSDYEIIYHMNQNTFDDNSTLDSTSNNRHGTPTSAGTATFGSNDLVDAIIGKGLDFDGINADIGNYIDLPDLDSSLFDPTYTISLWLNFDTLQHNRVYSFLATNNTDEIAMVQSHNIGTARFIGNTQIFDIANIITTNTWSYFTLVQNTTSATAYKDGVQIGSNSGNYTVVNVLRDSARLGGSIVYSADIYYDGQMDEFRFSNTARSADWIATEYANQKSPNTFYTVSGLEASRDPAADITPPVITLNGSSTITLQVGDTYTEQGATTDDNSTVRIGGDTVNTTKFGNYTVTYDARDTAGNNATQVNRTIIVYNSTIPIITLTGANPQIIELNSPYTELGAIVSSNSSEPVNLQINSSSVNTNQTGTYTVTYNATDAAGNNATQVNRTVIVQNTITLGTSWTTRQQIDINSSQIPTTLTNFTILISINSTNLNSSAVQSNGNDIRFTSSDGVSLLNHEIESFSNDITSGSLVAWVRIPTLSSFNDTTIFIYYNAPNATVLYLYTVWDSDYEIVYHMNQNTFDDNSTLDSTSNNRHGTPTSAGTATFGSNDLVDAIIGKGLDFDGTDAVNGNYIDLPDLDSSLFAPTYTISLWLNFDILEHNRVYSFLTKSNIAEIAMVQRLSTGDAIFIGNTQAINIVNTTTTNNWSHFTLVQNTASATAYKDGVQIGSNSNTYAVINLLRERAQLGGSIVYNGDKYYDGQIDEFRLSSTTRSADWITTEYNNQLSPNTFYTIYSPEVVDTAVDPTPPPPPVVTLQVTTYAGTGEKEFRNGDALNAQFDNPYGLALADNGDLYVADTLNDRIRIIYANGTVDTYAGSGVEGFKNGDALNAQFDNPYGLALAPSGDLYVGDVNNRLIRIIYANGTVDTYAGTAESDGFENGDASSARFSYPHDIALNSTSGDLYVADTFNQVIRIIYKNGTVGTYAGNGSAGYTNGDASSARFSFPRGLALADNGDLYVADAFNSRIRIIYANGTVDTYAGTGGVGSTNGNLSIATFIAPRGLALADNGDLYVADAIDNRIRIIYANGTVDTYAGTGGVGSTNGNLSNAEFNQPSSISLTTGGDLYVADNSNHRIRKISLDAPPMITLSGTNPQIIELNLVYTELGATVDDGSLIIINNSSVNTNQIGNYTVTYDATDDAGNDAIQVNRTVIVQDTIPPTITLFGNNPQFIKLNSKYTEFGANVDDNSGEQIAPQINSSSVNTNQIGTYIVTYDAADTSGNNATQVSRNVTVQDTTAPTITLFGNNPQIIKLNSKYTELGATVSDNSGEQIAPQINSSSVNTNQTGTYIVTYDAADTSENNATQVSRNVTVQNTTAPIITLFGNNPQIIELNSNYDELGATVDDNSTLIINSSSVNTNQIGNYTVTYDATDTADNKATQVNRTVIVQDTIPPTITLFGNNPQFIELNSKYTEFGANVSDNSGEQITPQINSSSVDTNQIGTYIVTYDAADTSGNNATQVSRNVTVQDTTAPTITLSGINPQFIKLNSNYDELGATVSDNSGEQIAPQINSSSVDTNQIGTYIVTYDAADTSGNNATQVSRNVTVQDTTAPTITLSGINPQFIKLNSNYDELGATVDDNSTLIINSSSVNTNQIGNYTVTYDATDTADNKATQVNRTVIVQDTTAPTITLFGNNPQIIELNSKYTEFGANVSDNSDEQITPQINSSSVDTNQIGTYIVTYDAADTSGNNATQVSRNVIVQDTTAPTITLSGINPQFIKLNSNYDELGATVDDNSTLIINSSSVNTNQIGNYTVTYDATDTADNKATQVNRTVIVQDITIPIITLTGANPQFISLHTSYTELGANVSDNSGKQIVPQINSSSVDTNQTGNYTVTYDAADDAGNDATQVNRTVIVQDITIPIITLTGANPQFISLHTSYTELGANVSDNSGKQIIPQINSSSVDTNQTGTYIVTYDAADTSGNNATQVSRNVTVQDTTAPTITLSGINPQFIKLNSNYDELGATVDDNSTLIINSSSVNTNQIGNYTVTYDATDTADNKATQVNRTVIVQDTTIPIITLTGANPQFISLHTSYTELGANVSDNSGKQIVPQINSSSVDTNQTGNYTVTYDAADDAGNDATQVNRTVIVQDTTIPIITLTGANPQFISLHTSYTELGANVSDNSGKQIIPQINSSSVDTNQTGNYAVTYDAADTAQNKATQVNRTVIVQDTTAPIITILGANPQFIKLHTSYTELGANVSDNSGKQIVPQINSSSVDTNQTGNYTVTYDATDTAQNKATQVNRTVIVQDTIPPVITLIGNSTITIEFGNTYTEQNATTDDNSTVIIGGNIVNTSRIGNYTVTYDATDTAKNNATQVNRTVIVQDTIPPIITLSGNKTQFIELNLPYPELGAIVDDGSTLIIDNSSVDTNQTGNYTVTYDATDDAGNNATQVNRTIIIQDTIAPIIVGTPVFDIQTSNLTITFSENVTISSNGLLLSGIGYSPNTTDYSNNPTLILSFDSDVATYLTNSTTSTSEYIIYPQTANAIQDTAGNNMSILNITIDVHYIVPTDNHIINSNLVRIDVPILTNSTHTNVTISYTPTSSTITPLTGGLYTKPVSESIITLKIPSSTIITHDGNWDSSFILPRTTTLTIPSTTEGRTTTTHESIIAITLGSIDTNLDLNSTATILFENYGGQGYAVYYINPNDSTPKQISSCDTSDIAEINTRLATIGECFIDDNTDITIYTTHLSTYGLVSTSASTTSGGILAPVSVGGGGGGSSGGGGAGSIYTGGTSPLTVKSILYKVSWETTDNKKLIEITAGPPSDNAFVTLISAKLGTVTAEPSITQPYSDRVVYLGIVDSSETFVQVKAGVYTNALFDSEIKLVDISQPTGSITFDSTSSVISPGKIVMDDDTMSDKTLDDDTMSDKTLDDDTMSDKTLDDDTMSDKTLDDDTMSDKTLDDDTMSDKTLDDDTMSDKTTSPGCLIATAVYGTELSQQVQMLREIRDTTLMTSIPGISFMTSFNQIYYTFSPIIADAERENPLLRQVIQTMLYPLLSSISIMTMADDSQNNVLALGLLVITINLLVYIALPTLAFIYLYKKIQSTKILS